MAYTNKQNIPKELAAAIAVDHYHDPNDKPSDYSVTNLISPVQQTELIRRNKTCSGFPQSDVLDNFNSWMGSVLHNAIEDAWKEGMGSIVEERFYTEIYDQILSGKVDCLDIESNTIQDWKTCKLYKVQSGDYTQWEQQANLYAMLARLNGYTIDKLTIVAMCLDWKKTESKYKKDYPQSPIVTIPLDVWSQEACMTFAKERITLRRLAKDMTSIQISKQIPCSLEDQWSKPNKYAMTKPGNKKATKLFNTEAEAHIYMQEKPQYKEYTLALRQSAKTRCEDYCDAKNYCHQYHNERKATTGELPPRIKGV